MKKYLTCALCRHRYSVTAEREEAGRVYICQDCSERDRARMQKRPPRLIYDKKGQATVTEEYEG